MNEFKNTFISGKMNKDIDSRLMPQGEYRDALNVKLSSSSGSDVGALENLLSNEQKTSLSLGTTVETIGAYFDSTADMVYWFVTSDTGDYVIEYDTINDISTIILTDTSAGVLNFSVDNLITGVGLLVDSDNDRRILTWTDDLNPIRYVNIATAKTYSANGFNNAQLSLIKSPPRFALAMVLSNTITDDENNIEERFLRFSYRYEYADGEKSAFAPFTETAFLPKDFSYDYATSSNESMINQYNQVDLSIDAGVEEVVGIDLLMKESDSNTVYLVESFNKEEEGWPDSSTQVFTFTNNKIYTALPDDQLPRLYDAVPLTAKALEIIGNRIILGNYTEGYNITNSGGNRIKIDFTLALNETPIVEGDPTQTMKSNRSYEVGIVYLDDFGRMSTVLTSPENTLQINNGNCITQNKIEVTLKHLPPSWATRYRFFLKQTRVDYDVLVPSIFYQDGVYVWLKIESDEATKIEVGDFIYVKSDSSQILEKAVQTRVLDIQVQPQNFLDETITATIEQVEGTYFKVKPSNYRLNQGDFEVYNYSGSALRSSATSNNFALAAGASFSYYDLPIYYGKGGLDDMTVTGTYTGGFDTRYIIEINQVGATDSFRWSNDDGASFSSDILITGAAQLLENGISVTFAAITGHDLSDNWIIPTKSSIVTTNWQEGGSPGDSGRRAIVAYESKSTSDESIPAGSSITINYDDSASGSNVNDQIAFVQTFISTSNYANIEEWFFGDNIINSITYPTSLTRVAFRRGTLPVPEIVEVDGRYTGTTPNNPMIMCFLSSANYVGAGTVTVTTSMSISELDSNIIFETVPLNVDSNLYYEIDRTYGIGGEFHQGFDGNDITQTGGNDAVLILNTFNAFSWGNGFESYKIKDLFNSSAMKIDTRPFTVINDYRQNKRIADLTYSKSFEQSTNFNGLNEFNLSTSNFLLMDDKYGSIQKLFSADTNLEVYQEDKVHYVLYQKDILFDADGNGNIRESSNVLGNTPIPWAGEYGISTHPESHAFYGNMRYFSDVRRGTLIRRSQDGITEITSGMRDYFRDAFRANPSTRKFGAYDLHNKEYVFYDEGQYTVGYDEIVKGFPSFYSFQPQWMGSLNNNFYSFSNGQLYRHYDESNPVRNNFYGVDYDSTIKLIINQGPSEIKVLKNLIIEGNKAWDTTIKSYLNDETVSITQSTITLSEYLRKEGKLYAYVRRNELTGDLTAKDVYGIGEITGFGADSIIIDNNFTSSLCIGDEVYNDSSVLIGNIISITPNFSPTSSLVVLDVPITVSTGDYVYGRKTGRIEGSEIRGYNFEVDLIDSTNTRTEIFALGSNMFKSWPS